MIALDVRNVRDTSFICAYILAQIARRAAASAAGTTNIARMPRGSHDPES
jgi:hypothetical protein